MPSHPLHRHCAAAAAILLALLSSAAGESQPSATPLTSALLDPAAFAEWIGGTERPLPADEAKNGPRDIIWTADSRPDWKPVRFGNDPATGPRHLRIGFTEAIPAGAILVGGGGRLSVLNADAPYPGDPGDDSQWTAATRLLDGATGDAPVPKSELALWVLPPDTRTRALRFTHQVKPADTESWGTLTGVAMLPGRVANLAPQAAITASAREEVAGLLHDHAHNDWTTWDNGETGASLPVSAAHPEWLLLSWPRKVALNGVALVWNGFAGAEVQVFRGGDDDPLAGSPDTNWETVAAADDLVTWYPHKLGTVWLDFARTQSSRALRLRITKPQTPNHDHLRDKVRDGHRVWLGEILAFSPLGGSPLESAILPAPEPPHPPLPIRFNLPEAGLVTLVIDDASGRRVRNLVSETAFPAGENTAWWDGSDDLLRDTGAAAHGLYHIPTRLVEPGQYRIRGLWRKPLELRYEMSIYSAGRPAWETADGTGCWMTNHTPPTSMAFVPGSRTADGVPLVMMGAFVSEGGHGLQWVREDGTKAGGQGRIGGTWTGAQSLAVDLGPQANPDHLAYTAAIWEGELLLNAKTRDLRDATILKLKLGDDPRPSDLPAAQRQPVLNAFDGGEKLFVLGGIAARDGLLVCSLVRQNELLLIDIAGAKVTGRIPLENPRGVAFDPEGRLLVLSGRRLLRLEKPTADATPETIIANGLEDPRHVVCNGAYHISDRGNGHVVRVFNAGGQATRVIGEPGGPAPGPYNPRRMREPNGIALDSQGRLWVAEADSHLKRVSLWSRDGEFLRAFYGPAEYGGGGTLDPQDPTRFFYKGLEFKLDWQAGTDEIVRVFHQPDDLLKAHYGPYSPDTPHYPASQPGQRFFSSSYTWNPTGGAPVVFIWRDDAPSARLVAGLGSAYDPSFLKTAPFRQCWPADIDPDKDERWKHPVIFFWSDTTGDGQPQPAEIRMRKVATGGITIMDDLSAAIARYDGSAVRLAPTITGGIPDYAAADVELLAGGAQGPASSGGDQALTGADGWTVLTNAPEPYSNYGLGGVRDGRPLWTYPSLWPGLHASHEAAVPDRPGMIVGHTRLLGGWVRPPGEGGPMFCVNGNMGNMYLLTADGLFVGTLFHDIRLRPNWSMPRADRGMDVSDLSLHDENFWPSITQTADGRVFLVNGSRTSLVRIDGLESIRRLPEQALTIGPADLQAARSWLASNATAAAGSLREPLDIPLGTAPPSIDGDLADWPATTRWATIDRRGTRANFNSNSTPYDVGAALRIANGTLFAAFRSNEKDLLRNSGGSPDSLFKTGGCLDFMLGSNTQADPARKSPVAGDLRLLVTIVDDQPRAILYRAVVPGSTKPVTFSSPWRSITIDAIEDLSSHVTLATNKSGNFEFSVPLTALHWAPESGHSYRGDLGILRGNGFQTLQRVYWSNKATAITSDVPSEAELSPDKWGTLRIIAAPPAPPPP